MAEEVWLCQKLNIRLILKLPFELNNNNKAFWLCKTFQIINLCRISDFDFCPGKKYIFAKYYTQYRLKIQ